MAIRGWTRRRLVVMVAAGVMMLTVVAAVWGRPVALSGTIAYARDNQIRLVSASGEEDRLLWSGPSGAAISGLDWRHDGGALAFTSDLEADCSVYQSDVYTLLADGRGLRRATNSPLCEQTADFPTGSVSVTIDNRVPDYSAFQLYIQGAPAATAVTVPPGTTKTITVTNVADLGGALAQRIVVIREGTRWYDPAVTVNVVAGTTATATGPLVLLPDGLTRFGASHPAWQHDGASIGFVFGEGELRRAAPYPVVAEPDTVLASDVSADLLALSPISGTLLYAGETGIYLLEPDEPGPGTPAVMNEAGQQVLGLDWLPDGQGFIFTQSDAAGTSANLYRYDLTTAEITPLTSLTSGFLRHPGVSPDGGAVVVERAARPDSAAELWVLDLAGGELTPLGVIGALPDWRPERRVSLFAFFYLPLVGDRIVGVTPTHTPTPTQTPSPTPPPTSTPQATTTAQPTSTAEPSPTGSPATPGASPSATPISGATATPSATPAASLTPSPTPANLPPLMNGDFEGGPNGDWAEKINNVSAPGSLVVRSEPFMTPRSGEYVAWLGGFNNQIHHLSQPVTLSGPAPLYVQFYYRIASNEATCAVDRVEVLVNDAVSAAFPLCVAEAGTGWERATVDLGSYLGQAVTISWEGTFDEATVSSFFIDDVSFVRAP